MSPSAPRRPMRSVLRAAARIAAAVLLAAPIVFPLAHLSAQSGPQSFTSLQSGFTQKVFGVSGAFLGGVAFAPNGDPWVDESCGFSGSPLHRYANDVTYTSHGTVLHQETVVSSAAGCGLTNHPDAVTVGEATVPVLYSNVNVPADGGPFGVAQLNADTGELITYMGPPGNALGITVDPKTRHLVYAAANCSITSTSTPTCDIIDLNPMDGTNTTLVSLPNTVTNFVDGIAFDPAGEFLFLSNRRWNGQLEGSFRLTILAVSDVNLGLPRTATLVRNVPITSEPDGVAVHLTAPKFVVTNNNDGSMTRFDFPANDFTQTPTTSTFASGGFRGDLVGVGPDACAYVTQEGTRYDDGSTDGNNSLVQICPGFAPLPGQSPTFSDTQNFDSTGVQTRSFSDPYGAEVRLTNNVLRPFHLTMTTRTVDCGVEKSTRFTQFPFGYPYPNAAAGGSCWRYEFQKPPSDGGGPPVANVDYRPPYHIEVREFHIAGNVGGIVTIGADNPTPRPAIYHETSPSTAGYDEILPMTAFARNECNCLIDADGNLYSTFLLGDRGNVRTDLNFKWDWPLVPPPPFPFTDFPRTPEGFVILPHWLTSFFPLPVAFDLKTTGGALVTDRVVLLTVTSGPQENKVVMPVPSFANFNIGRHFKFVSNFVTDDGRVMINKYVYLLDLRRYPVNAPGDSYLIDIVDVGAGAGMALQHIRFVIQ